MHICMHIYKNVTVNAAVINIMNLALLTNTCQSHLTIHNFIHLFICIYFGGKYKLSIYISLYADVAVLTSNQLVLPTSMH